MDQYMLSPADPKPPTYLVAHWRCKKNSRATANTSVTLDLPIRGTESHIGEPVRPRRQVHVPGTREHLQSGLEVTCKHPQTTGKRHTHFLEVEDRTQKSHCQRPGNHSDVLGMHNICIDAITTTKTAEDINIA